MEKDREDGIEEPTAKRLKVILLQQLKFKY